MTPNFGDDFRREASPRQHISAVLVAAFIGRPPEELIEQIAVRAMDFDAIEAQLFGRLRACGEGFDHVFDIRGGHIRWTHRRHAGLEFNLRRNYCSDMPKLRKNEPAGRVDLVGDVLPSSQRAFTMKARDIRMESRDVMIDECSLGDDQADAAFGATAIIGRDVWARNAFRRMRPRHGGHHDAVLEFESFELERAEQGFGGTV